MMKGPFHKIEFVQTKTYDRLSHSIPLGLRDYSKVAGMPPAASMGLIKNPTF